MCILTNVYYCSYVGKCYVLRCGAVVGLYSNIEHGLSPQKTADSFIIMAYKCKTKQNISIATEMHGLNMSFTVYSNATSWCRGKAVYSQQKIQVRFPAPPGPSLETVRFVMQIITSASTFFVNYIVV